MRPLSVAMIGFLSFLFAAAPQAAEAQSNETVRAEIREALSNWTANFNAKNEKEICDLFARDLRYDYRGFPERDYGAICDILRRSLQDTAKQYAYSLNIKEILVLGDLAVVRLIWTLKITGEGVPYGAISNEPGMDIFAKQPDGRWRIIRYIAYEEPA